MRDVEAWRPTKYLLGPRGLRANRAEVGYGSWLMVDLQAAAYERMLAAHAAGTLVDVGCGQAPLYLVYRSRVREAVLVDWAGTLHPSPCVDLACDLNQGIALPDGSADTVLASAVLEHLHRPEVLFAESARLLRPGGVLLLGVPFMYGIHEQPHDYHRYTAFRLRQLCAEHGLEVVSLEPVGGAGDVLLDLSAKVVAPSRVLRALHRAAAALLRATPQARRLRVRTAELFPLAYALVARKPAARSA